MSILVKTQNGCLLFLDMGDNIENRSIETHKKKKKKKKVKSYLWGSNSIHTLYFYHNDIDQTRLQGNTHMLMK